MSSPENTREDIMKHRVRWVTALAAAAIPLLASASSHREAPNITRFPTVDSTDFYMFMSYEPGRDNYVTLLADSSTFSVGSWGAIAQPAPTSILSTEQRPAVPPELGPSDLITSVCVLD